ncbi:MAG: hypothetical protein AABY46_03980 [Nitrospirota bacterium]
MARKIIKKAKPPVDECNEPWCRMFWHAMAYFAGNERVKAYHPGVDKPDRYPIEPGCHVPPWVRP